LVFVTAGFSWETTPSDQAGDTANCSIRAARAIPMPLELIEKPFRTLSFDIVGDLKPSRWWVQIVVAVAIQ
jgi:hypothetical protein